MSNVALEVEQEIRKDIFIYHLKGSLTINTINYFQNLVLIKDVKQKIAINLGEVDFIDSSGIGAIIGILHELTQTNGELICYNLKDEVYNIFETAQLISFLNVLSFREFKRRYPKYKTTDDIIKG